ncbi:MAG: zf-HC2 domain-containing protein [Nitrospirota bacterium]
MSCPKTKLISAYLDAELQGSDKAALETHLQGCVQCGTALTDLRSLRSAFANTERHQAPYGFAARVMARTAVLEKKRAPWHVPLFVRFAEAAVLLVVITVGILAGKGMTNSSSAAPTMNITSSLSLDMFDAAPPGSLGGAYLAMTEAGNEK